jgi:aryl-alcohol dehydrogenase-like predicted oxidoreductase
MPYRVLGSTGEQVSAIGLGGWHLGFKRVDAHLSLRIVRSAIDRGITFLDNCWDSVRRVTAELIPVQHGKG